MSQEREGSVPPAQNPPSPQAEAAPEQQHRRRRPSRSLSASSQSYESDAGPSNRRRRNKKRGGGGQNLPLAGVEENPATSLTNTIGGAVDQVGQRAQDDGSKKDTLKLRLDLNLDVAVEIKARVHGDITLSLLD